MTQKNPVPAMTSPRTTPEEGKRSVPANLRTKASDTDEALAAARGAHSTHRPRGAGLSAAQVTQRQWGGGLARDVRRSYLEGDLAVDDVFRCFVDGLVVGAGIAA